MSKPVAWSNRPLRTCRTMHDCCICGTEIRRGHSYRDGGYDRRAHEHCAERKDRAVADNEEFERIFADECAAIIRETMEASDGE